MGNVSLTQEFIDDMGIALGSSLIDVELTNNDYSYAFDQAKRTFIQRGNNNYDRKFYSLSVITDQTVYTLPSAENIDTVIKLIRPRASFGYAANPHQAAAIQNFFNGSYGGGSGFDAMSFELGRQLMDDFDIYIAYQPQFIWKKRNNELTLLNPPKVDETWMVEVYADLSDVEYEQVLWIRNYTIAGLKIILGRAYRKFSALSTPTGETSLDGEQLVSEGKEEQLVLLENIADYVDGDPIGSVFLIG
jgi:hypothetical protein